MKFAKHKRNNGNGIFLTEFACAYPTVGVFERINSSWFHDDVLPKKIYNYNESSVERAGQPCLSVHGKERRLRRDLHLEVDDRKHFLSNSDDISGFSQLQAGAHADDFSRGTFFQNADASNIKCFWLTCLPHWHDPQTAEMLLNLVRFR